jgi:sortase A
MARLRAPILAAAALTSALLLASSGHVLLRSGATAERGDYPRVVAAGVAPPPTVPAALAAPPTVPATLAAPPTVPATLPALPQPVPPPADPYEDVPVIPVGRVDIPRIGVAETVFEGVWRTVLDRGPGHWPGTAEPGGWGNTVIAGHRSTYTQPFRRIDELVPGDAIVVTTGNGSFTYQVTGHEIVDERGLHIVDQHPGRELTLFSCHPPGSEQYRYVVHGTLVGSEPR